VFQKKKNPKCPLYNSPIGSWNKKAFLVVSIATDTEKTTEHCLNSQEPNVMGICQNLESTGEFFVAHVPT
jgi:hypothetical protein